MKSNILIPTKCKVGFNERSDTYTKLLGYVIAFDGKIWRKEPSWLKWIWSYKTEEELQEEKQKEFEHKRQININCYNEKTVDEATRKSYRLTEKTVEEYLVKYKLNK